MKPWREDLHHRDPKGRFSPFAWAVSAIMAGDISTTFEAHRKGDRWTPDRHKLHEDIIAEIIGDAHPSDHPEVTFLGGGPGSGKSTVASKIGLAKDAVVVDSDRIKTMLPEYDALPLETRAWATHEESSWLANEVYTRALASHDDVTYDGTAADYDKLSARVEAARESGYQVDATFVTISVEEAERRAIERSKTEGRFVPLEVIRAKHDEFAVSLGRAVEEDLFDSLTLWDNTGEVPVATLVHAAAETKDDTAMLEHKAVPVSGVTVIDEEQGIVSAIVSVTGIVDRVKDIILPGSYTKTLQERTPKGIWHHDWKLPIARTLEIDELMPGDPRLPETLPNGDPWPSKAGALLVKMLFNLGTQRGRDAYSDVLFYGPEMEWCADEETEILTSRGWLTLDEVKEGDEAYVLDTDFAAGRFEAIESVNIWPHKKRTLRNIETGGHSSMTTAAHRWPLASNEDGGRVKWTTTENLQAQDRIIRTASRSDAPVEPKYSDSFVELVGWFWTEGWRHADTLYLGQSTAKNPQHCASIRAALDSTFPDDWSEAHAKDDMARFRITKAAAASILAVMGADKEPTPDFIMSLTRAQLLLLIETCLSGDGHVTESGQATWYQVSESGVRAFEMICALAGKPTNTTPQKDYGNRHGRPPTRVSILRSGVSKPLDAIRVKGYGYKSGEARTPATDEWVEVDGRVWCPTTPSGTWLARRRGTVYFTGNSIGYKVSPGAAIMKGGNRIISQLDLFEYSGVLFGAMPSARTYTSVKDAQSHWSEVKGELFGSCDDGQGTCCLSCGEKVDPDDPETKSEHSHGRWVLDFEGHAPEGLPDVVGSFPSEKAAERWVDLYTKSLDGETPKAMPGMRLAESTEVPEDTMIAQVAECDPDENPVVALAKATAALATAVVEMAGHADTEKDEATMPEDTELPPGLDLYPDEAKADSTGWAAAGDNRDKQGRPMPSSGESTMKVALQKMQSGSETPEEMTARLKLDTGNPTEVGMAYFNTAPSTPPVEADSPRIITGNPGDSAWQGNTDSLFDPILNDAVSTGIQANFAAALAAEGVGMSPTGSIAFQALAAAIYGARQMPNPEDRLQVASSFLSGHDMVSAYDSCVDELARDTDEKAKLMAEALQLDMLTTFGPGWRARIGKLPGPSLSEIISGYGTPENQARTMKIVNGIVAPPAVGAPTAEEDPTAPAKGEAPSKGGVSPISGVAPPPAPPKKGEAGYGAKAEPEVEPEPEGEPAVENPDDSNEDEMGGDPLDTEDYNDLQLALPEELWSEIHRFDLSALGSPETTPAEEDVNLLAVIFVVAQGDEAGGEALEDQDPEETKALDAMVADWTPEYVFDLMAKMDPYELEELIFDIESKAAGVSPVAEATGGRVSGRNNKGNIKPILHWFEYGPGAQRIRWGVPGDFMRCVTLASKHMTPENAKGFCAKRHKKALGVWPGGETGHRNQKGHGRKSDEDGIILTADDLWVMQAVVDRLRMDV